MFIESIPEEKNHQLDNDNVHTNQQNYHKHLETFLTKVCSWTLRFMLIGLAIDSQVECILD